MIASFFGSEGFANLVRLAAIPMLLFQKVGHGQRHLEALGLATVTANLLLGQGLVQSQQEGRQEGKQKPLSVFERKRGWRDTKIKLYCVLLIRDCQG